MKKLYLIGVLIILILSLTFTSVYAVATTVSFNGENKVAPGSTNKIAINITSDDTIGGIEGKIETSSNISKLLSSNITGKNGWTVTYNAESGIFNAFKAEGTKNEDVLEIEYTVNNQEGTANIELKELVITNITYEEEEINDVSKTITIAKSENVDPKKDDKNGEQKQDENDEAKQEDKNQTKSENIVSTKEDTKITPATKKESTTSTTASLPKTGVFSIIIPIVILGAIAIVVSYLGYKKYRGIK